MTTKAIAIGAAVLALTSGCNDGRREAQGPAAAAAAGCPDMPLAPPPAGSSASRTMIGQPLKLPTPPPPVQVVINVKCLPAGSVIPKHKHPWQRYVFLETGTVTVTFEDPVPQVKTFSAGQLLVESTDTWHSVRVGDAPAKLIVIDQVPETNPPTNNAINWPGPGDTAGHGRK